VDCKADENMSTVMMSEKTPKRPAKGQTGNKKEVNIIRAHRENHERKRERKNN
jgi:hypothetical protein